VPTVARVALRGDAQSPPCAPEGRGEPPRGWIGCAGDDGPRRDLTAAERLASGLPVDLNGATAAELALVPGLSARLGAEVVADRAAAGAFRTVDELARVRGVGPARLARARPHLFVGTSRVEEWAPRRD
jgi:competence protein ComEA